eukprot:m51a1_g12049 hypothetical protein (447) ;mRNA; r:134-1781
MAMLTADPEFLVTFEAAGGVVNYGVIERSTPAQSPLRSYAEFKAALENVRDLIGFDTVQKKKRALNATAWSDSNPTAESAEEVFSRELAAEFSKIVDEVNNVVTDEQTFQTAAARATEHEATWYEETVAARNANLKTAITLSAAAAAATEGSPTKAQLLEAAIDATFKVVVDFLGLVLTAAIANKLQPGFWKNLAMKTANKLAELYASNSVVKQIFVEIGAKDLAATLRSALSIFQWTIWGIKSLALILLAFFSSGTSEIARIVMVLLDVPELIASVVACIKQWKSYNSTKDTASHVFGASNAQNGFVYIVSTANPRLVLDVKDSSTAIGTDIVVSTFSGATSQQWKFDNDGMVTTCNGGGCLDDWGGLMKVGDSLKLGYWYAGQSKGNKLFRCLQNGAISLINADLVLEISGDIASGSPVKLMPFNTLDSTAQSWRMVSTYSLSF